MFYISTIFGLLTMTEVHAVAIATMLPTTTELPSTTLVVEEFDG